MNKNANFTLQWLILLSRKERQMLLDHALGGFRLSDAFRDLLRTQEINVPEGARVWMDYPLDWIYAAIRLGETDPEGTHSEVIDSPNFAINDEAPQVLVNQNQEDVDLLIAFEDRERLHLIMLEAKGETAWDQVQFTSKANRLNKILVSANRWDKSRVSPAFLLISPRQSKRLKSDGCPSWMLKNGTLQWIELYQPPESARIERFDRTTGTKSKAGAAWRVVIDRRAT